MLNFRIILLLVMLSELCVCHESRHVLLHLPLIEHHVFTSSQRHPSHPAILLQYYSYFHWGSGARDELEDSHWPPNVRKEQTLIEYYY